MGRGYWFLLSSVNLRFWRELVDVLAFIVEIYVTWYPGTRKRRLGSAIVKYKDFTVQESLTIFSVTMQLSSPGCCISI